MQYSSRADPLDWKSKPPTQKLVSAADFKPHEKRYEQPPQDGRNDKRNEQDRKVETEILICSPLGKTEERDRTETGGKHRNSHNPPVHVATADEVVFVVLLPSSTVHRQTKDHRQVNQAD